MIDTHDYWAKLTDVYRRIEWTGGEHGDYAADLTALMLATRRRRGRLYFIGNGGSAAIALHMTTDYLKNGHMRTVDMYAPATITCLGNDFAYDYIFSKQLEMLAERGDVLVAISSSGNSANIINAANVVHQAGGTVVTLTGFSPDNKLRRLGDHNLYVPSHEYGVVESLHNLVLQQIVDMIYGGDNE